MERVPAGEIQLAVESRGSGVPLLCVHGFPLNRSMWNAQLAGLADSCRVIAPDLRGMGDSDVTEGTVGMSQYADDLAAALDSLGIVEPVVFCGLSMGGYIAWQFAERYPDRLRGLILCDTRAAADSAEARTGRMRLIELVEQHGAEPVANTMAGKLLAPSNAASRPELVAELRDMILGTPAAGITAALRGMAERPDMTDVLPTLGVPALVLCGEEDAITPADEMEQMAGQIPDATFVRVAGAGHMAPMEQPELVNAAIREFLSRPM